MTKFVGWIYWCLLYLISLLPLRVFYVISNLLCFILKNIVGYRKSVIETNISKSFPDLLYHDVKKIRDDYYKYMCDIALESIWTISASAKKISNMIKVENPHLLDELCAKHEKIVLMMGHVGNWEIIGGIVDNAEDAGDDSYKKNAIYLTYKELTNAVSESLFMKIRMDMYAKFKIKGSVIESKRILRHILTNKERGMYVFIADQSPSADRVLAKFLNQPTLFFGGPEYVVRKMNLPAVYMGMDRIKRGEYRVRFELITEAGAEMESKEITRRYAALLEESINATKYNWLWSHKRWKLKLTPEEDEEYKKFNV